VSPVKCGALEMIENTRHVHALRDIVIIYSISYSFIGMITIMADENVYNNKSALGDVKNPRDFKGGRIWNLGGMIKRVHGQGIGWV
jgi:hypothetical protein